MRAILPLHAAGIDQPQIRLVDERCRLQRMAGPFVRHVPAGDAAELAVHEGRQFLERSVIPLCPADEQARDVMGGRRRQNTLPRSRPWTAGHS